MESEAGRAESEAERVGAKAQRAESEAGRAESEAGRAESKAWRAESKAWRLESEAQRVESGAGRAQASLQPMFELFTPKSAAPSLGPGRAMAPGQPQLPTGHQCDPLSQSEGKDRDAPGRWRHAHMPMPHAGGSGPPGTSNNVKERPSPPYLY